MIRSSPVLPLIGGGTTKFQPVFVGDMAAGLLELLRRSDTAGKTYEFGGPQVYSFKALLELLLAALNRQRILLPIPFSVAEVKAGLLELFPNPPLTRDQVQLLKTDKVVSGREPTLGDLDVEPRRLDDFLLDGHVLGRGRLGGRRRRRLRGRGTDVAAEHEEGADCDRDAQRADDEIESSVAAIAVSHSHYPSARRLIAAVSNTLAKNATSSIATIPSVYEDQGFKMRVGSA